VRASCPAGRLAGQQANRPAKLRGWPAGKPACRSTGRLADWEASQQIGRAAKGQAGQPTLVGRPTCQPTRHQAGWSAGWLAGRRPTSWV